MAVCRARAPGSPMVLQLALSERKGSREREKQPRIEGVKEKDTCRSCQCQSSQEQPSDDTVPPKPDPHLPLRKVRRRTAVQGRAGALLNDQFGTSNQPRVYR